jgi:membrane-bound ClpP family serine protease
MLTSSVPTRPTRATSEVYGVLGFVCTVFGYVILWRVTGGRVDANVWVQALLVAVTLEVFLLRRRLRALENAAGAARER